MGELAGWPYWKVISITGQSGAGTDYQVKLEIGDSAGGGFHLEGHCTNFPQDIRITDDDGTTLLDHFVEDLTADPIVVHVEVKDDLGSNQDIRVYYGKSGETTASNITNTFPDFSDHFPGSSVDTSKWNTAGTPSVASSILTLNADREYIYGKTTFGTGYALLSRSSIDLLTDNGIGFWTAPPTYVPLIEFKQGDPFGYFDKYVTRTHVSANALTDIGNTYTGYHTWDIQRNGSTSVIFEIDGSVVATHTTQLTSNSLYPALGVWNAAASLTSDWVVIRKYNSPEPAFSSAGAEQTPSGVSPTSVFYGPLVGPFGGPI